MNRIFLSIVSATLLLASCNPKEATFGEEDGLAAFSSDSLGKHIAELSGDDFEGRKPFTAGETKTIQYLKEKFIAAGLEPGNGESYFQEVPMVNITTDAAPVMQVKSAKGNFTLQGPDDYVLWTNKTDAAVSLNNDELVFAGYGVVAPEYNWNDYKGLDVKGKVVMVLVNDPGFNAGDTSLFKGKTMTYYGRWTYKFEEAARQGAKACLVIHNTEAASYPFTVVQNNWNASRLRLDPRGREEQLCDMIGWVSGPAAKKLLTAAGKDTTLFTSADVRGFKGTALNLGLSTSIRVKTNYNQSNNVIGKITGSKYPDETIIYTAHWDHLGIGTPDETGDSIYNGALDNASATAGLLELARGFKSLPTQPERTIVFLSVTAEEQGLWGSAYYAQNPVYPSNKTVANINMDGLNWYGKTKDVIIVGQGQSELEDYLQEEAAKVNRTITPEVHPEAGYYYRSDHFNFAKAGIPALYISSGIDVIGKESGYGKKMNDIYTEKNYHRPSDEYDATWKLDGAIDDLQLLFRVGRRLAYGQSWPQWKTGSEFKAIRESR
ncbi:M28 family metallopeptidase [Agriterribacter sp.]|uniref:M28 family metallopeptidase n=1 Tax=Agriterribacter sp. TaxID=2821509 RepID=UPI002CFF73C8|nr:M28 family metallopeptidase [Agriterribacter sp.]HRO47819.1 M28 family metallopeptidase [Agriterribacter sp.]HRQ15874.1 M28 family metallopeptidase [Agriterribacter sp.]